MNFGRVLIGVWSCYQFGSFLKRGWLYFEWSLVVGWILFGCVLYEVRF